MTIEEDGEYEAYELLLSLKVDCAVMVFSNINPGAGACNELYGTCPPP